MNQETSRSPDLPQPLRAVASGLKHVPGAGQVGKVTGGALDRIGAVSPRGRRMAVYAGAGVLGVAGVVEWPVALTGAAVAWLTRPRPVQEPDRASPNGGTRTGRAHEHRPGTETEAEPDTSSYGPGDKLASSHYRHDPPEQHVHEQPAKVGDTATASALKQVAEATTHHGPHGEEPDREQAHRHGHDSRPTG
ncbi:hypothetical protein ABZ016_42790 [Streptomyces sp. NPDC006372]|uniref:hypothetical protein n=1 Tax=Streptomyces sp. NPDC006372 TaxID=3155599 RepID=UPI0033B16D2A